MQRVIWISLVWREPRSTLDPDTTLCRSVTTSTTKVDTRIRGRQVAVRVSSDAVDDKWRYGTMRLDIKPDGMRGG